MEPPAFFPVGAIWQVQGGSKLPQSKAQRAASAAGLHYESRATSNVRLASALFLVALVLAVLAMVAAPKSLAAAAVAIFATISLMAVMRHLARVAYLRPYFDPRALPVEGQWVVFGIFAVLLVAGLVTVGGMLYQLFRSGASRAPSA